MARRFTGPYRSFSHRGWPTATVGDKVVGHVTCEDEYVPRQVREGRHKPLRVRVADYRQDGPGFTWRRLKQEASTLDEAKEIFRAFLEAHPEVFKL